MKTHSLASAVVAFALLAFAPTLGRAQMTVGNADTNGTPDTINPGAAYGEAIVAPNNSQLTTVTVNLATIDGGGTLAGFVAAWSGTQGTPVSAVVPSLTYLTTDLPGFNGNGVVTFDFTSSNIHLNPGHIYIIGFSDVVDDNWPDNALNTSNVAPIAPFDLGFVVSSGLGVDNYGAPVSTWSYAGGTGGVTSASIQANFASGVTAVPEASHYAIFGLGLCLALAVYQQRRRKDSAAIEMPSLSV